MARNRYSGDKRRRELDKKKKKERKRRERAERAASGGADTPEEDTSYLEYLNPGGPVDARYMPEDEPSEEESDGEETGEGVER